MSLVAIAQRSSRISQKALVLGPLGLARMIVDGFQKCGIEALTEADLDSPFLTKGKSVDIERLRFRLSRLMQDPRIGPDTQTLIIHPGSSEWGYCPELYSVATELGYSVIGPTPKQVRIFTQTTQILSEAEACDVPHLALNFDPFLSQRELEDFLIKAKPDYHIILKSVRHWGPSRFLRFRSDSDFRSEFEHWQEQLRLTVGDSSFYIERNLGDARLFELPFFRNVDGKVSFYSVIDASLQHSARRLIDFAYNDLDVNRGLHHEDDSVADSRPISVTAIGNIQKDVSKLAERLQIVGFGSFSFLCDGYRHYLIGGDLGLTQSYLLWSSFTDDNPIELSLNNRLKGNGCKASKHTQGMLIHFYSENPVLDIPYPGYVSKISSDLKLSDVGKKHCDFDLYLDCISNLKSPEDGLLGTLKVVSDRRSMLLDEAGHLLKEFGILGTLQTNEAYVAEILNHPFIKEGFFHAGFLDEEYTPSLEIDRIEMEAAVQIAFEMSMKKNGKFFVGRHPVAVPSSDPSKSIVREGTWQTDGQVGMFGHCILPDGQSNKVFCAFPVSTDRWNIRVGSTYYTVRRVDEKPKLLEGQKKTAIYALCQGRVHALYYLEGSVVKPHQTLAMIESQGRLVSHASPLEILVKKWKVAAEDEVKIGQEILEVDIIRKAKG